MNVKYLMILAIFSLFSCTAYSLSLENGIVKNAQNTHELTQTTSAKAYAYGTAMLTHRNAGDQGVLSFYIQEDVNRVISLSRGMKLYITNLQNDNVIGTWPLSRWEGELTPEIEAIYSIDGKDGRLLDATVLDKKYSYAFHPSGFESSLACMMETPLRYGDVLAIPGQELVVFLGRPMHKDSKGNRTLDIVFFSTSKQQVIFALRAAKEDQGAQPGDDDYYTHPTPEHPQYITNAYVDSASKGSRSYAKMFIDDFSGSAGQDILVWRKRYESRLIKDPVQGFSLQNNLFNHYKLLEGRYVLQGTSEDTIRGWLAAKELTWQKGFPSKSECPGQEGQLIPEMHDALLNDPDVLQ